MVLGTGLAPFRGGIVQFVNAVGAGEIVRRLEELAAKHGPRFAPANAVARMPRAGTNARAAGSSGTSRAAPSRSFTRNHERKSRSCQLSNVRTRSRWRRPRTCLETAPPKALGFVKSLFFGRLRGEHVLPYPQQDADEKRRTDELIVKLDAFLKAEVDPDRIDAEEKSPATRHRRPGAARRAGMTVPTGVWRRRIHAQLVLPRARSTSPSTAPRGRFSSARDQSIG